MFWRAIHVIQHVNSEASIYVDFINCDEYRPAHSCILYLELACKQSGEEERIYDHLHVSFVVTHQFGLLACQCSCILHSLQQLRVLLLVVLAWPFQHYYFCPVRHRHVEHLGIHLVFKLVLCLHE